MDFNDCSRNALELDEVLQKILEFTASGEPFSKTSQLRVVCKKWRSMSFKGLSRSKLLPEVHFQYPKDDFLLRNEYVDCVGYSMDCNRFRKKFPKTCPAHIALSQPRLPIRLKFVKPPCLKDFAFIREFSHLIGSVFLIYCPLTSDDDKEPNENQIFDFILPNLTGLCISWRKIIKREPWEQLLKHIMDTSNRLGVVRYMYPDGLVKFSPENVLPITPPQVTHVELRGLATDLARLINPVKKLVDLNLVLHEYDGTHDASAESLATNEILERHSSTLQTVCIKKGIITFPLILKLGQLPELLSLETDSSVLFSKDESNPTTYPKLKKLKYRIGYSCHLEKSEALKVSHLASNSLAKLDLSCYQSQKWFTKTPKEESWEKDLLQDFEGEHFPVYPALLELHISALSLRFGLALMPKVFSCMTNLSSLRLEYIRKQETSTSYTAFTSDLFKMLTGVAPEDIPTDEKLWPGLLKDKTDAITNLKNLSQLEIHTCGSSKGVFGRFIFKSAFLQLQKLKMLNIGGGITVENEMIQEWKSWGRAIDISDYKVFRR